MFVFYTFYVEKKDLVHIKQKIVLLANFIYVPELQIFTIFLCLPYTVFARTPYFGRYFHNDIHAFSKHIYTYIKGGSGNSPLLQINTFIRLEQVHDNKRNLEVARKHLFCWSSLR